MEYPIKLELTPASPELQDYPVQTRNGGIIFSRGKRDLEGRPTGKWFYFTYHGELAFISKISNYEKGRLSGPSYRYYINYFAPILCKHALLDEIEDWDSKKRCIIRVRHFTAGHVTLDTGMLNGDFQGPYTLYSHASGKKIMQGKYENLNKEGRWWELNEKSGVVTITHFKKGQRHGLTSTYNKKGMLLQRTNYVRGQPRGWHYTYHSVSGKLIGTRRIK